MKAIVLYSGGLDSTLALILMQRLGIDTVPVSFLLPFRRMEEATRGKQPAGLKIVPLEEDYLAMLQAPRYGRGKHLNPCVDCHLFMLRRAKAMMPEVGADFVVTGDVLGQRPMSQHKPSLDLIARESGLGGLILRPLSARLLDPTIPEERGWVPRDQLLEIRGRGRKVQYELAQAWG
jgi:tRNA U34 2-thiouridine synthase MnmA/TrmU